MSSSERKKQRREQRYLRNKKKEEDYKKEAWESGKLIEENHNNKPYSPLYTSELGTRLYNILKDIEFKARDFTDVEKRRDYVVYRFRAYRKKIQDYILHYDPGTPKTEAYETLKYMLECYWDCPDKLWEEIQK
jgi:hypothetical protein